MTQHQKCDKVRACVHAQVLCILRVSVFVSLHLLLMWFVSCLSSVLLSFFMLYLYCFRSQFSVVGGILFTATAWRYRNKDNLGKIDEAFKGSTLPVPMGQAPLWGPGSIPDMWADVCGSSQATWFSTHSESHEQLWACDQLIKVSIMRHGSIWTPLTGATLGDRKVNTIDTFPSKNVLLHIVTGNRKDTQVKS